VVGAGSVKFVTDGGFDTYARYPRTFIARWNLTPATVLKFRVYAENPSPYDFQNGSPWIRLKDADNNYFEYQYYMNGSPYNLLNQAIGQWRSYEVPLDASSTTQTGWRRTTVGSPSLANIQFLEMHADTWDSGFTLWWDGVGFDLPPPAPADLDGDGDVDEDDLDIFESCATGPGMAGPPSGCSSLNFGKADFDSDQDVDQKDFAGFQRCFSGTELGDANCLDL